ncbi:DUF2238 domain-containing protein [Pseudomonas sp. Choline-02u-1]|jgi:uncharacterized membrane protein YjdF|uniref:DUF2238 domain-containing protein n=1 Tax=unclassified Pseudomonas TaxID=196821 RepID=UPI000C32DCFF|nr:DUF2238 domain-containing protein [Pseudomonas sp. Choline-02u-1]PKH77045.1 DUF2238 domain-containing protein [Pseudomonas sp. Choline-02u-1]
MLVRVSPTVARPADPRIEAALLGGFVLLAFALGIAPRSRVDWLLENVLALALVLALLLAHRRFRLSTLSLGMIFAFLCVHEVGAHYTYSRVPYDQWSTLLTGVSVNQVFGLERNHYDRLVHLSYGLLLVWPMREVLLRLTPLRGAWLALMTLNVVLATSAVYELIEWIGGAYLGDDTGQAFVGAQNDPWDSQKDMALALFGAGLSLLVLTRWRRTPR